MKFITKIHFRYITFLFLFLRYVHTHAQDLPTSQNYLSFLTLNPANVTFLSQPSLILNYRNQWPGLDAPYKNYSISYNHLLPSLNSGIGVNISNDAQGNGVINELNMDVIFGYHVKVSSYSSFNFGFVTTFSQRNYQTGALTFEDPTEFVNGLNKTYLDFGLGFRGRYRYIDAGFSAKHITNPIYVSGAGSGFKKDMIINIHTGGHIPIGYNTIYQPDLFISPAFSFMQQGIHQQLQYGANMIKSPFLFGLHFRQNLGFNFDSFSISVGFLQSSYNFVYSYDVSAPWSGVKVKNSGAHEVTFLWKFEYNEKSKKYRAIKCPEI